MKPTTILTTRPIPNTTAYMTTPATNATMTTIFSTTTIGLGKAIASAGTSATMDAHNAMASLVGSSPVPNYLFSKVNPQDAIAAYNGLLEFKDVVKAAQR